MLTYTVKNVIKDLDILLKSSLKMQEMLFSKFRGGKPQDPPSDVSSL